MTKFLNLDELSSAATKSVKFKGVEHHAAELTVKSYMERVAKAKSVEADSAKGSEDTVQRAVELIGEVFPTMTPAVLEGLPMHKLQALIEFALSAPEDIAAEAEKQGAAGNA